MTGLQALVGGIMVMFLVGGLPHPLWADNGPRPPIIIPLTPEGSPDSQRFRPETPGQTIRQNREQLREYKEVPPPASPNNKEEKPPQEETEKVK